MKYLSFILLITLFLTGCKLDLGSSDDTNHHEKLIGTWRAETDDGVHYLKITQDNFQQYDEVTALSCSSLNLDGSYSANGELITFKNEEYAMYKSQENQLTLTDSNNNIIHYDRITPPLENICNTTPIEGVWKRIDLNDIDVYIEFKTNSYQASLNIEPLSCLSKKPDSSFFTHNNQILIESLGQEFLFNFTLENNKLTLLDPDFDPNEHDLNDKKEEYLLYQDSLPSSCGSESLTKTISVDIGYKYLPTNLQDYLEESENNLLDYDTEVYFDMDDSGDITTGDLEFRVASVWFPNEGTTFTSWNDITGIVGYIEKTSENSRSSYYVSDVVFNVEDNHITVMANASDFSLLNEITSGTQIYVSSSIDFNELTQRDRYPDNYDSFTSAVDTSFLEDIEGDASITSTWDVTPMVDITTVEITITD